MSIRVLLASVALLLCASISRADDPTPAAIDAVFSQFNDKTPGVALAVIRDEKVIYSHGYGLANLDHSIPISSNTVFDVGSTSKQFTAACILLLAEDGKLALTDDVRTYFPELPRYDKPITINHLLHHTSGLRDYTAIMGLANMSIESDYPESQLLKIIFRQKGLNYTPGERFSYTNTGFFLLGEIVRKVAGMPMSQFAKARIFEPLGMASTIFWDDHTMIVPHRADSYYPADKGGYVLAISLMDNVGDGGIYTTTDDLARWDANFYHNKLGKGSPEFLEQMHRVGLLNDGKPCGYASGLFIGTHNGLRMVSHGGAWRGFRAELVRFPDKKLSVICLANLSRINSTALALQVADLYLPAGKAPQPEGAAAAAPSPDPTIIIPKGQWEKFEGRYKADAGPVWTITRNGDALAITSSSGLTFLARPVAALEFESTTRPQLARLKFVTGDHGEIFSLTQTMENTPDVRLTPIEPLPDPTAGLANFEGTYDSDEIGGWMRITVSNGQLHISSTDDEPPSPITRYSPDGFTFPGMELLFLRGKDGKAESFTVNSPRASGMRYVKRPSR